MNINLLAVARVIGDLKISINGEAKVGLAINGVWSNNLTQTLTGDQGNLYPFDPSNNAHALGALQAVLKNIDIVPYQNDSRYEKYATKAADDWVKEKAWDLIADGLRDNSRAFQLTTSFTEEGEKEPSIVIFAEIVTNDYVNGIFEVVKSAKYIGEVVNSDISPEGQITLTIRDADGKEAETKMSYQGDLFLFGIDSVSAAKHYYMNTNGTHVLSNEKHDFQPEGGSEKVTV